ncbi:Crp/Fnr family transcriptional regulator [Streptomyces virginiae]|uniref:Crp/Fnr family transcriptional regulator n=1 Tax=Streptomyces virginiae TaxID=1961 RepID=UPI0035DBE3F8
MRLVSGPDGRRGYAGILGPGDLLPIESEGVRDDTWHTLGALTDLALVTLPDYWAAGQALRATQEQLIRSEARVLRLSVWGVKRRLAFEIRELADRAGRECAEGVVVDLLRQDQWALLVGATRVSVARALSQLAESGAIHTRRNEIVIRDSAYLERLVLEDY